MSHDSRPVALALLVMLTGLFTGCGIGHNRVMFGTKTNLGIDASTTPTPSLNLTYGRQEGVIQPAFEGGKTLPVVASFKFGEENFFKGAYVGSTFSTGDAAFAMAKLYGEPTPTSNGDFEKWLKGASVTDRTYHTGDIQLNNEVKGASASTNPIGKALDWLVGPKKLQNGGESRAVVFGTDSSVGLKVAWSGTAGPYPDTVRFGYGRREFAFAPVAQTEEAGKYRISTTSLLATIDHDMRLKSVTDNKIDHLQYFATGEAATMLALQQPVRRAFIRRTDPEAAKWEAKGVDSVQIAALLNQIYSISRTPESLQNDSLKKVKDLLDEFGDDVKINEKLVFFESPGGTIKPVPSTVGDAKHFKRFQSYFGDIGHSITVLENTKDPIYILHLEALRNEDESLKKQARESEKVRNAMRLFASVLSAN